MLKDIDIACEILNELEYCPFHDRALQDCENAPQFCVECIKQEIEFRAQCEGERK